MQSTAIDWSFINKVIQQSQMKLSKTDVYKLLVKNKLIKKNGLPTKYAQNNGLVGSDPLKHGNLRTPYRRLMALIPNNYILQLKKQPKSMETNQKISFYLDLRKALLNKPLNEFTKNEWLGLLTVAYRAYKAINGKNLILSSKLRLQYHSLCAMYIKYSPDSTLAKQDVIHSRQKAEHLW